MPTSCVVAHDLAGDADVGRGSGDAIVKVARRSLHRYRVEKVMRAVAFSLLGCSMLITASMTFAEADGPDYWQVAGVAKDDVLNIREQPDPDSKKVGQIPPDGTCIKNLGCVGGLTFEEFTTLSDEEKKRIEHERPRWCKVEYRGTTGWVAGRYVEEGYCEQPSASESD
jgi:hypothetical protein